MAKQMLVPAGVYGKSLRLMYVSEGTFVRYRLSNDRRLFFYTTHANYPVLEDGTVSETTDEFPSPNDMVDAFQPKDLPGLQIVNDRRIVWSKEKVGSGTVSGPTLRQIAPAVVVLMALDELDEPEPKKDSEKK